MLAFVGSWATSLDPAHKKTANATVITSTTVIASTTTMTSSVSTTVTTTTTNTTPKTNIPVNSNTQPTETGDHPNNKEEEEEWTQVTRGKKKSPSKAPKLSPPKTGENQSTEEG